MHWRGTGNASQPRNQSGRGTVVDSDAVSVGSVFRAAPLGIWVVLTSESKHDDSIACIQIRACQFQDIHTYLLPSCNAFVDLREKLGEVCDITLEMASCKSVPCGILSVHSSLLCNSIWPVFDSTCHARKHPQRLDSCEVVQFHFILCMLFWKQRTRSIFNTTIAPSNSNVEHDDGDSPWWIIRSCKCKSEGLL